MKFEDFLRTSKRLSCCFQGLKLKKNTDLHVKIYLEMLESITKDISLRKLVYNCSALFDAAYAAPNKGTTI